MSYFNEIRGIKLKINYLLLALIAIYLFLGYGIEIFIGIASVFLHELAHVLMSIRLGVELKEIELFPFGGIAKSESLFWFSTSEEIIIAVIGPIVNFGIATIAFMLSEMGFSYSITETIIKSNILIGGFNILPIFPLDGGKILRGLLSEKIGFKICTKLLTTITYTITAFFMIYGLLQIIFYKEGVYIVLISIFVLLAAKKENKMAAFFFINEILKKRGELKKKRVMGTHLLVGMKTVKAKEITGYFLPKRYHIIIVIDNTGKSIGNINENDLLDGILEFGIDVTLEKLLITKEK